MCYNEQVFGKNYAAVLFWLSLFGLVLAWTNPPGNPPIGGGALSVSADGNNYVLIDTPAPGRQLRVVNGDVRIDNGRQLRFRSAAGVGDWNFILGADDRLQWRNPSNAGVLFVNIDGGIGIGATPTEKLDIAGGELRFGGGIGRLGGLENDDMNSFLYHNASYTGIYNRRDNNASSSILRVGNNGLSYAINGPGIGSFNPQYYFNILPDPSTPVGLSEKNLQIGLHAIPTTGQRLVIGGSAGSYAFTSDGTQLQFLGNGANYINLPNGGSLSIKIGSKEFIFTNQGELRLPDPNDGTKNRIWGEGRPGVAVRDTAGECSRTVNGEDIKISRNNITTHWDGSAVGCPANWWVCTAAERGAGICAATSAIVDSNHNNCVVENGLSGNHDHLVRYNYGYGWVADKLITGGIYAAEYIANSGTVGSADPICWTMLVWCCAYR